MKEWLSCKGIFDKIEMAQAVYGATYTLQVYNKGDCNGIENVPTEKCLCMVLAPVQACSGR
jgi:hypothetical protein